MMQPIYLHGMAHISAQNTIEKHYFFESIESSTHYPISAHEPEYKTLIPPLQLRRMNKSMRLALFTAKVALEEAHMDTVNAIILGSGMGCLTDSEKFVEAMLEDEQQRFNPTPFIQSTHNMAAATLALALQCKGYNMTYVNNANSVASAVQDSQLHLMEHPEDVVIFGGVEELGKQSPQFWQWAGFSEIEHPSLPPSPQTQKEMVSEGAALFVASAQVRPQTIATLHGVAYDLEASEPELFLQNFMKEHAIEPDQIDAVLLGIVPTQIGDAPLQAMAQSLLPHAAQVGYKHVLGDHDSMAASALAIACQILQNQSIPETLLFKSGRATPIRQILIYHQRRGKQSSIFWLSNAF
jgi:3-oxoacyl-[acyl-carrier-protein] synthase II